MENCCGARVTAVARGALDNRRAGVLDQVGSHAAVERQFHNALVLHHVSDAGGLRFHQRRVGFHLHLLIYGADFQRNIDGRIGCNLQHDAGLNIMC